mmetsp:Transcript_60937/g.199506  ORF Transcript_60937/g.199506 Transcript_60937/m.199506 type:complete len:233 (+) Transcript_60937:581-1279(+)
MFAGAAKAGRVLAQRCRRAVRLDRALLLLRARLGLGAVRTAVGDVSREGAASCRRRGAEAHGRANDHRLLRDRRPPLPCRARAAARDQCGGGRRHRRAGGGPGGRAVGAAVLPERAKLSGRPGARPEVAQEIVRARRELGTYAGGPAVQHVPHCIRDPTADASVGDGCGNRRAGASARTGGSRSLDSELGLARSSGLALPRLRSCAPGVAVPREISRRPLGRDRLADGGMED